MIISDIKLLDAFDFLSKYHNSYLVDTRSKEEWLSTGIPDLSSINKEVICIEWSQIIDQNFINCYKKLLFSKFNKNDKLFFICRSGVRSLMAAKLALNFGFKNCYNVYEGYNNQNHSNWKKKLPIRSFMHR